MTNIQLISIKPATVTSRKKYTATFVIDGSEKKISFGDKSYPDYTTHHNTSRRSLYRMRHRTKFQNAPIVSAAALS
eukprot:2234020-Pleurochrysis_carterae.AAC.1